ncbi:DsbA family protein [Lujinxingia vulgaris]|uniref:DsbA family protein n=1 Tax=Lujinxingia vulgaris TaxID=2600176 RepID=UPI001E417692|nr:thioredoxin domain-containing protein [Lujinxingia vulgaris]
MKRNDDDAREYTMRHRMWMMRSGMCALLGTVVLGVGCASGGGATVELSVEQCVSQEGQRFLTYCASPQAAEQARRYEVMERARAAGESVDAMIPLPTEGAPAWGEADAPVTVQVFADLRCGYCARGHQTLKAMMEAREGVRVLYRFWPLSEDAELEGAHRALVAAQAQGKFWEYLEKIYEAQGEFGERRLEAMAAEVGLDVARWREDRDGAYTEQVIARDRAIGERVGVQGTPTYFVNGVRVVGAVEPSEWMAVVDGELEAAGELLDAGVAAEAVSWRRTLENYQPVDWQEVAEVEEEAVAQGFEVAYIPVGESAVKGASAEDARVTVVVFSDFQCGFCERARHTWDALVEQYGEAGLRLVYKHYPLPSHARAGHAAAASVVVEDGGDFWKMHDLLFEAEGDLSDASLEAMAREAGYEGDDLYERMRSDAVTARIQADVEAGYNAGVQGTPTFFINGIKLAGAWEVEELAPLIEDQLELGGVLAELAEAEGEELYRALVEVNQEPPER